MSKIVLKCTSATDKNPVKISQEDYNNLFNIINNLVNKYNFEFEGGGFYIDSTIK